MQEMTVIGQAVGRWSPKIPISTAPPGLQRHGAASGSPNAQLRSKSQPDQSNHPTVVPTLS